MLPPDKTGFLSGAVFFDPEICFSQLHTGCVSVEQHQNNTQLIVIDLVH